MATCPSCKHQNTDDAVLCTNCAQLLRAVEDAGSTAGGGGRTYRVPGPEALEALNAEAHDPDLFPPDVRAMRREGKGIAAWKLLRSRNRGETNPERKAARARHLEDLRLWLQPAGSAPTLYTLNGVGTTIYGKHQPRDGTWIATTWFCVVFVPIIPIASYLVSSAGPRSYYFLARAPHPPVAGGVGKVVLAAVALAALTGTAAAMWSGSHGRLAAYNGFDVPVDVTVDGATERVEPYDTRWFSGLAANTTVHLAARVGDELLEERDASVTTADTVWNVAGRGVMAKVDVTYGQVEALPTTFYDTDDVAVVEADYVLATPPSTVETGEHEAGAHRSLVTDILRYGTPTPLEEIAGNYASEHPDAARAALGAELRVHPANVAAAMILAPMLAYDQAATLALWTRVRDAAPEDVQAHRAYQEATGMTPDVIAEYKARAEAAPTAVNLYLYGRLLGDDAASTPIYRQALAADPDFPRTHYALGRVAASEGEWATASAEFATYARLAPEGGEDVHRDQLWLARLLGGTADTPAVKALIGEDRYGINTAVWRLADAPERLAAEKLAVGERFAADPEVKDGPSLGLTSAELDLVAGDLVAAREAIAELAEKHPDVDTTFLSVLVELSDGGDHTELARLLATDPKVGSPYLMLLDAAAARALGVEGAAGRIDAVKAMFAGHHSSFPGVVDLRPDDDAGLRALIDHLEPEQRLYALHIAAWAAEGTGDMRRARARRLAARAVALPGVGPYVHP